VVVKGTAERGRVLTVQESTGICLIIGAVMPRRGVVLWRVLLQVDQSTQTKVVRIEHLLIEKGGCASDGPHIHQARQSPGKPLETPAVIIVCWSGKQELKSVEEKKKVTKREALVGTDGAESN
jgi:hypothetical protein